MQHELIADLRGMHFRHSDPTNPSPAKLLVEALPNGAPLALLREPSNEYDPNAIQAWVSPSALPEGDLLEGSEFAEKLAGFGWDLEKLRESPELMLGYVGKEWAALLAPLADRGVAMTAVFCVNGKGKPATRITYDHD